jgi:isoleucyl-tRNA synthetase
VEAAYEAYDFRGVQSAIYDFCNDTLSATYFVATKDRLYCDKADSPRRRGCQRVLREMCDGLCRLLAPMLPHTADEAWRALHKVPDVDRTRSVHLERFLNVGVAAADPAWTEVMEARVAAQGAIERAKGELGVENPLDTCVIMPDREGVLGKFDLTDLADLLGVSRVVLDASAAAPSVRDLRGEPRCERSWRRDGTVKARGPQGAMLSDRDAAAVGLV